MMLHLFLLGKCTIDFLVAMHNLSWTAATSVKAAAGWSPRMPSTMPAPRREVRIPTALPFGLPAERQAREVDGWLDRSFTGAADEPMTVVFDLDPLPYEPGVGYLVELVKGAGRELGDRNQGRVVLVFASSREPVREAVRALASTNDIPVYLAPNVRQIGKAEPAIPLTPAKRMTLEAVAAAGRATASLVAGATGSSPVAAGNALSELHTQGLLLRHEGSGRVAHTYEHPAAAAEAPAIPAAVALPRSLSEEIAEIASLSGREADDLIAEAWREFMSKRSTELAQRYEVIAGQIHSGDSAGLLESLMQDASEASRER